MRRGWKRDVKNLQGKKEKKKKKIYRTQHVSKDKGRGLGVLLIMRFAKNESR